MSKFIFTCFTIIVIKQISYAQPIQIEEHKISISCKEIQGIFKIEIRNDEQDTIYLFSTYIDTSFYSSSTLHRFNKAKEQYKISFLPLLPYLQIKKPDLIRYNSDKVVSNQNVYAFMTIVPKDTFTLFFDSDFLFPLSMTKDFDLKNIKIDTRKPSLFNYPQKPKSLKTKKLKSDIDSIVFEFAIYHPQQISFMQQTSNLYLNTNGFKKQALNFTVLDCILPIYPITKGN